MSDCAHDWTHRTGADAREVCAKCGETRHRHWTLTESDRRFLKSLHITDD